MCSTRACDADRERPAQAEDHQDGLRRRPFVFDHSQLGIGAQSLSEEKIQMAQDKSAHADRIIAEAIRNSQARELGYREQALKIYPWICGRCTREFTRENLQQLTVHHKDHNHDNNPADGSNWELLCLYCHDNEHSRELDAAAARQAGIDATDGARGQQKKRATGQPFANLKDLLKRSDG
jgi:hypothetical protein